MFRFLVIASDCLPPNGLIGGIAGMQDVNASTETEYPVKNNNSMNKKLEAAKKWLKEREKIKNGVNHG